MPPKFVYFDIGNVLLSFDNDRMRRQMADVAGVSEEAVRRATIPAGTHDDLQWRFEAGEVSPEEYYEEFCSVTGARPPLAELKLAANDMFAPIEATVRLASGLAGRGYRLGLLSNTNAWHFAFMLERYRVLSDAFEVHVTSFGAKSMKPDRKIYDVAIKRAGVGAGEVFFTDDRPENVAGALEAGIDAVPFTTAEQLAGDLRSRGVECD